LTALSQPVDPESHLGGLSRLIASLAGDHIGAFNESKGLLLNQAVKTRFQGVTNRLEPSLGVKGLA
jgi:hypothetical protein